MPTETVHQRHGADDAPFLQRHARKERAAASDLRVAFQGDLAARNMRGLFGVDRADQPLAAEVVHRAEERRAGRDSRIVLHLDAEPAVEGAVGADVDMRVKSDLSG